MVGQGEFLVMPLTAIMRGKRSSEVKRLTLSISGCLWASQLSSLFRTRSRSRVSRGISAFSMLQSIFVPGPCGPGMSRGPITAYLLLATITSI